MDEGYTEDWTKKIKEYLKELPESQYKDAMNDLKDAFGEFEDILMGRKGEVGEYVENIGRFLKDKLEKYTKRGEKTGM